MGQSTMAVRLSLKADYSVKPLGFRWRTHTLFIVSTVGIGLFADLFLYGLVVPILPFLLRDRIGLPQSQIQSHTSSLLAAYAGASVLFSPVAGAIADATSSRQLPFVGGTFALILATVLLFTGRSVAVLAVARVFQGASGAFVWTIGMALCIDTVGPENLGKTIGTIFSFISVGELFAPVVGGALYEKSGYAGVLGVGVGLVAIDLIMRLLVIEKKVAARYEAQVSDVNGTSHQTSRTRDGGEVQEQTREGDAADEETALLGGKGPDEFTIPHQEEQPWVYRRIPILFCLTHSASLVLSLVVAFVQATLIASFEATVTTEANELYGFDSFKSGLLFVPLGVLNCIMGPISGWAVDRYGVKPLAVIGYTYLVPALCLLRIPKAEPLTQQSILFGGLLGICGIGLASIGAPSLVEAGAVVDKFYKKNPTFFGEQGPYAQLYGLNSMAFSLGLAVGPLIAGDLRERIGYGNMNAVLAGISGVTAVSCYIWLGGYPTLLKRSSK